MSCAPHRGSFRRRHAALVAAAWLVPTITSAQAIQEGPWQYRASIYGYFPSVSGTSRFPTSGSSIEVDSDKLADSLKFFFMGALEAHNGRWGVFTDVLYLNLGEDRTNSRDFTIAGTLPVGTTANLGWDFKGVAWTLAGEYRLQTDPALTADFLAGVRMAQLKSSLTYSIAGSLGSLPPTARSGSLENRETNWDAIIGVRGRYAFGDGRRWLVPFHFDVGTGESSLTWQAAAGLGYAFSWGEVSLLYRYLAYDMKSGSSIQDLRLSGPMLGATFKF